LVASTLTPGEPQGSSRAGRTSNTDALDRYLSSYTPFNAWLIGRRYQELSRFFVGETCLELGSSEGSGTEHLLRRFQRVVAVDGSELALEALRGRYQTERLETIHSLFEELDLGGRTFDTVLLAHVLEHVDDPIATLVAARDLLRPDGVLIVDVPNGDSLHRQVGVKMGLLRERTELNDADRSIGHQRVYTPKTFQRDIETAGLRLKTFGGMFIKVLSNAQTERVFDEAQLEALFTVGCDNPAIAAEIFVVATR
jgi:2-polyprenyl-3-methyl-5-hydroxy-6-metoxy-1,4-benzoquinol methylase